MSETLFIAVIDFLWPVALATAVICGLFFLADRLINKRKD
jgi:hypothetical protein